MPIDSGNLALKGLDDLFSTEENRQEEQREQVQQIPIDALHPFTNHPFKVLDDEAMTRTVESIAQYEPCGMAEIKSYKPSTNSISEGQVLSTPYPYDKAKLIVREMAEILMFRLTEKKLVTESITLEVGYDRENVDKGGYRGLTQTDRYGRIIPKAAHGTVRFDAPTNLGSTLVNESAKLFERITNPALTVRRITLNANKVTPDEGIYLQKLEDTL